MVKRKHTTWFNQAPRLNDDRSRTPANSVLVNAYLMLTEAGEQVERYMQAVGIPVPDVPAPANSTIKPVARWFATLSHDDASGLLAQAQADKAAPVISKGHV